jgi:hypothetical protein
MMTARYEEYLQEEQGKEQRIKQTKLLKVIVLLETMCVIPRR